METSAQTVRIRPKAVGGQIGSGWQWLTHTRSDKAEQIALIREVPQPDLSWYVQSLAQQTELNQSLLARLDTEQKLVEAMRAQFDQLRKEALTDPLTGLLNRRAFEQRLQHLWQKSGEDRLAVLLLNIDTIQRINHTYGYAGGDSVIYWLAEALRQSLRGSDTAYRFSSEKFLLLIEDRPINEAVRIAEVIRARVERTRLSSYRNRTEPLTVSIGVAARKYQDDPLSLLERADRALCMAKRGGCNQVMRET